MEKIKRDAVNTPLCLVYRVLMVALLETVFLPFETRTVTVFFEPTWLTDLETFIDGRLIFLTSLDIDERII